LSEKRFSRKKRQNSTEQNDGTPDVHNKLILPATAPQFNHRTS